MINENKEGIELILNLHRKLKLKDPNNKLLSLIEIDKKEDIKTEYDFDKIYCRDFDNSKLNAYVRYSIDLLKALDKDDKTKEIEVYFSNEPLKLETDIYFSEE